jgi:mannose-6-phosphate isomerase-like protein (cupin superfamily)
MKGGREGGSRKAQELSLGPGVSSAKFPLAFQPRTWPMHGFVDDIEELTKTNSNFRKVLYTGKHLQLVLMALKPGEDIGEEIHKDRDQFFRIEQGKGEVVIDGTTRKVKRDDAIVVPAGARHNVINTGDKALKLYTLYGPPNHLDQLVEATKADAAASREVFAGATTE